MSVQVNWYDDEQTIVLYTFHPNWMWGDFYPVFEQALVMEQSKAHRVDVIVDYSQPYNIPLEFINNLRHITAQQPGNLHLSVMVSHHRASVMMLRAAGNIIPPVRQYFRVASTLLEAVRLIEEDRYQSAKGGAS